MMIWTCSILQKVFWKVNKEKMYQPCKIDACFAYKKNFNDIIDDIYEHIKDNKKQ